MIDAYFSYILGFNFVLFDYIIGNSRYRVSYIIGFDVVLFDYIIGNFRC